MAEHILTFEAAASALLESLPRFTPDEQRLAHAIYRRLAEGGPVPKDRLAADLGWAGESVAEALGRPNLSALTFTDEEDRIVGFGGLAVAGGLPHRFRVRGRDLYTWCAWDSLFLPPILGAPAEVVSPPPGGGEPVRLTVRPDGVERVTPEGAVLSFILPTAEAFDDDVHKAMAAFCHFVYFFRDRETAEAWTAARPGTFILSLAEGFELGRRMNETRWGAVMGARE